MGVEVVERLPFEQYKQLPGIHFSSLKHALTSGLQYQHNELFGLPDCDVFRQGRAGHTGILEPQRFLAEYAQWETEHEDGRKRVRRGEAWDDFCSANAGKTILTPDQYEIACSVRDLVRDHPVAGPLVRAVGKSELTIRWTHARTGADCKARLDRIIPGVAVVDIKMTHDPEPRAFSNLAARLRYHLQGAFYRDAAEAAGFGRLPYKIIAVQSKKPHDVVVYHLPDELLAEGQEQYERALDVVLDCRKKQQWPGMQTDHEFTLTLPAWATPLPAWATPSAEDELTFGGESIF